MKLKLALIGKNISHSKSKEIYTNLLGYEVDYTLLDYSSPMEIESLDKLFLDYDGISITSPYKKYFLDKVSLNDGIAKLGFINCIRKSEGHFEGTNTDYLAIIEILEHLEKEFSKIEVLLLGDGSMSKMTQIILDNKKIEYKVLSRKKMGPLEEVNLSDSFNQGKKKKIVINSCAREFVFTGDLPHDAIFWDYNYAFLQHEERLSKIIESYRDGYELLKLQGRHALNFWK